MIYLNESVSWSGIELKTLELAISLTLLLLSYKFIVMINILLLFVRVPWVGLQCVIVVFSDHTHLLFVTIEIQAQILELMAYT